jgi:hypothetical protein
MMHVHPPVGPGRDAGTLGGVLASSPSRCTAGARPPVRVALGAAASGIRGSTAAARRAVIGLLAEALRRLRAGDACSARAVRLSVPLPGARQLCVGDHAAAASHGLASPLPALQLTRQAAGWPDNVAPIPPSWRRARPVLLPTCCLPRPGCAGAHRRLYVRMRAAGRRLQRAPAPSGRDKYMHAGGTAWRWGQAWGRRLYMRG